MSIEEAARRRDFTVNAISWDPLTGEYFDPANGRDDLNRRILKAVDLDTFGDDSLRVLRAVQFAARFEMTLDEQTKALCRSIRLDDLPPERIWGEIEKLLLRAQRPSIGFAVALELGVIDQLFPELKALVGCEQEPEWHPEGDVWVHTLQVIDQARQRIDDLDRADQLIVMLGAVTHDFGKPATTAFIDGRIRSINHEEEGVAPASAFLDRLNIHSIDGKDVRGQVLGLVAHHLKPGMLYKVREQLTDGAFRRLSQKANLELLARVAKSDCLGRVPGNFDCSAMDWFLERARELGVDRSPPKPLLLGRHLLELGMPPGPDMGALLKQIYEKQLDGEIKTTEEGIALASQIAAVSTQMRRDAESAEFLIENSLRLRVSAVRQLLRRRVPARGGILPAAAAHWCRPNAASATSRARVPAGRGRADPAPARRHTRRASCALRRAAHGARRAASTGGATIPRRWR